MATITFTAFDTYVSGDIIDLVADPQHQIIAAR